MAPHKQPSSLYDLAHKTTVTLLYDSCHRIAARHGTYDSRACVRAVEDLQAVLLSSVPPTMWSDMCESLALLLAGNVKVGDTHEYVFHPPVFDGEFVAVRKIAYALFAHERLTHINLLCGFINYRAVNSTLYVQKNSLRFWETIFKKSHNVRKIVFSLDDLLEYGSSVNSMWMFDVIGKYCKDLEEICLPLNMHTEVIKPLLKCKKLRRISGDEESQEWTFSVADSRLILKSLPNLEYFKHPELIKCFKGIKDGRSLKLTHLYIEQDESTPANVTLAIRLCPNLKSLEAVPTSMQKCKTILNILADSSINLTALNVESEIPSSNDCQRFFSAKGVNLLHLKLHFDYSGFSFELVSLIGECCLNLESLSIEQSYQDVDQVGPPSSDVPMHLPSPVFKNLTTLKLEDEPGYWDRRFFKWCLLNATNLKKLYLNNPEHPTLNQEDFYDLFFSERFSELVDVEFHLFSVNKEMLRCLRDNCPKLRRLDIVCFDDIIEVQVTEYVKSWRQYNVSNNIDMLIDFES